jgi:hypothetical protein
MQAVISEEAGLHAASPSDSFSHHIMDAIRPFQGGLSE